MNARVEAVMEQARNLTAVEQVELIDALYELVSPPDPEWEAAWAAECERRSGEYERGEVVAEDFDVVMERMRQKYLKK